MRRHWRQRGWTMAAWLLRDGLDEPQAQQHLPFAQLPLPAQAVAWLVFTHHRLPCMPVKQSQGMEAEDLRTYPVYLPPLWCAPQLHQHQRS